MTWLKDPLVTFLVVGACVFVLASVLSKDDISYDIEIDTALVTRLQEHWSAQMKREPSSQESAKLVDQYVRDEIYFREANRLQLDANDSIVRRRMIQKLRFLTEDIALSKQANEEELRRYYRDHQERYQEPARYSFSHRYFSPDRRADAKADAHAALETDTPGDPFMLQTTFERSTGSQLRSLFGTAFAEAITALHPSKAPAGPIPSAYGWHTVLLHDVEPGRLPGFSEVAERVASDASQFARRHANETYFEELKTRYNVTYTGVKPALP